MRYLPSLVSRSNDWLDAVRREKSERSLAEFTKMAWHVLEPSTPLRWGWALDAICEHLEAVTRGEITRLVINVPPGTMKSLLTSVIWPAWEWGPKNLQQMRFLSTAHKQDLAIRDSMKCRRLIKSAFYQNLWTVSLTGDQNAKTKFENSRTGVRECSAFNSLTGLRADRVILDDPHSVDDANSQAKIASDINTFREALPSRVNNDDSAIVIIMQRLAVGDVSDVAVELGYEHLRIPMRFEQGWSKHVVGKGDPRAIEGELMFPERFSEKTVIQLEVSLGSHSAAGQLQQRPVPRGGLLFKAAWFMRYRERSAIGQVQQIVQSWDTANKDKPSNAPTVCTTWARTTHGFYLLDVYRERVEFPDLVRDFIRQAHKWKPHAVLVEDKASGQQLIQYISSMTPALWRVLLEESGLTRAPELSIIPVRPHADKRTRALGITPLFESRQVFLPESESWVARYEDELLNFPASAFADQVDSTSQALHWFTRDETSFSVSHG